MDVLSLVTTAHEQARRAGAAARDLTTRADLDDLLRDFYGRALADPLLRTVFVDEVGLDLEAHLPVVGAFWERVLLGTGAYSGRTMDVHRGVHARIPLTAAHFDRWLALWQASVDAGFRGPGAEQAKAHAARMAAAFLRGLSAPAGLPLLATAAAARGPSRPSAS